MEQFDRTLDHIQVQIEQLDLEGAWVALSEAHVYEIEVGRPVRMTEHVMVAVAIDVADEVAARMQRCPPRSHSYEQRGRGRQGRSVMWSLEYALIVGYTQRVFFCRDAEP